MNDDSSRWTAQLQVGTSAPPAGSFANAHARNQGGHTPPSWNTGSTHSSVPTQRSRPLTLVQTSGKAALLLAICGLSAHLERVDSPDPVTRLNAALEGRYRIEREGGMATVFLAKDLKHNRNVALKVLKPGSSGGGRRQFVRSGEADAIEVARLWEDEWT